MNNMTFDHDHRPDNVIELPTSARIRDASLSTDPDAPKKLAKSHADQCMNGYVAFSERALVHAEAELAEARSRLEAAERRRDTEQRFQFLAAETPLPERRNPWWQRGYNGLKCFVALLAPFMGGAYLVTNMLDQSYTLAEQPWLAALASGPILLASFALSSWAILPTDVRRVERRSATLLLLSAAAFLMWAGAMSVRFGVAPPEAEPLGAGFDPTAVATSAFGTWIEVNGVSVTALFVHLLAEAMLSAACISSAICSGRKVLPVDAVTTSIDVKLAAEVQDARADLRAAQNRVEEFHSNHDASTSRRQILFEETEQAVLAEREKLQAREAVAVADVRSRY